MYGAYHDWRCDFFDELPVLIAINVGRKRVFRDSTPPRDHNFLTITTWASPNTVSISRHNCVYLVGLRDDVFCHGTFHAVTGDDDAVLLAWGPTFQELSAYSVLQHTWTGQHDATSNIVEPVQVLQGADIFEVPGPTLTSSVSSSLGLSHSLAEQSLDVVVHSTDICLVNDHTLAS